MRTDFITLQEHLSVHEAREHFISQLASDDIPGQVFVVAGKKLRGSLSVKSYSRKRISTSLSAT